MADYPKDSLGDDISALQETGNGGDDIGRGNNSFNAAEVGQLTDTSSSEAAAAGHAARDDMASEGDYGVPSNRHDD